MAAVGLHDALVRGSYALVVDQTEVSLISRQGQRPATHIPTAASGISHLHTAAGRRNHGVASRAADTALQVVPEKLG